MTLRRLILLFFICAVSIGPLTRQALAANILDFTVTTSKSVTVNTAGGTPRLKLNVGGVDRYADYISGSGSSSLIFRYTTQAGDLDLDGITVASPLELNGATITDAQGNPLSPLTFTLPGTTGVKIDHPSLAMNFLTNDYLLESTRYNSLAAFLSAAGGTLNRAGVGTYYDTSGVLQTAAAGVPRFDHDPITHAQKGILIEEQRANIFIRSEEFDNSYWIKSQASVTTNALASPAGTISAEKIVESNTTGIHEIQRSGLSIPANTTATATVFAKAGERTILRLYAAETTGSDSVLANFNLASGTVGATAVTSTGVVDRTSIENVGNGWYRCSLSFRLTGNAVTRVHFALRNADGAGTSSYAGDGTSGLYIWGAQLETGTFPTSYIPTTTATVTRPGDNMSIPTGSWYLASAITLAGEYSSYAPPGVSTRLASLNDNDVFQIANAQASVVIAQKRISGVVTNIVGPPYSANTAYKVAAASDATSSPIAVNGVFYAGSVAGVPSGIVRLNPGSQSGGNYLNGWIKTLKYYPARVSDSQLQLLTQ